ncbi:MAG: Mov34/MPN/PAD-1 family protein [Candidatus Jordarchaeaceae archaeon]
MRAVIYPSALSKIIDFTGIDSRKESAGFLIGKIVGKKIVITDSTITKHTSTAAYVVVDDTEMAEVAEELDARGEGETIIGWWHSHPGMGAGFMSGTDLATQQKYQKMFPKALALVIDPTTFFKTGKIEDLDYKIYTVTSEGYKPVEIEIAQNSNEILITTFKSIKSLRKDLQRVIQKGEKNITTETAKKIRSTTEAHIIILTLWTITLIITITLIYLSL